jgi:hypothetical protein
VNSNRVIVDELQATRRKVDATVSGCNYIYDDFYPATVTDVIAEEIHALNRESLIPAPSMTRRKH